MGWNIDRFIAKESIVDEFICAICTDVVENPVQTPCQHLFCNECIRRWINEGHRTCPEDRQALTVNVLKTPNCKIFCRLHYFKRVRVFEKFCEMPFFNFRSCGVLS